MSKAANVNYVNDDGYTALIYATESGQGHIVEVFTGATEGWSLKLGQTY